jgi:signal peptidase I
LAAKWPSRWQQWSLAGSDVQADWQHKADGFETAGTTADPAWLRYRHLIPSEGDWENILNRWEEIQQGTWSVGPDASRGQLITDYYAYNDGIERSIKLNDPLGLKALGMHWVGDLAVECQVEVKSNQGELLLELVEGGTRYECRINVADGNARFSIDGGRQTFVGDDGTTADHPSAATKIRGGGSYQLRFSNVDDQLLLWIDNRPISFNGPTTYVAPDNVRPYWTPADPGDLEPAGVGSRGAALLVSRLRILRDVYYIATNIQYQDNDYDGPFSATQIQEVLTDPGSWSTAPLFDVGVRRTVDFEMGDDQFFPLGDNSPQSRDARLWSSKEENPDAPDPYVPRKLLTGKALLIYWPHHWRWPTPFLPNFKRMGLIR